MTVEFKSSDREFDPTEFGDRVYRESGAVPMLGIVLTLLFGTLGSGFLGILYGLFAWYVTIGMILFFMLLLLGIFVGSIISWAGKAGRVRNGMFLGLVGFSLGLLTVYFTWAGYVAGMQFSGVGGLLGEPWEWRIISEAMTRLRADPVPWNFFDWAPPRPVVSVFWGLEALMIVVLVWGAAMSDHPPYCEHCDRWTDVVEPATPLRFDPNHEVAIRSALRSESIEELPPPGGDYDPHDCLELRMTRCRNCEASSYLMLVHHTVTIDDDGDEDEDEEPIIPWILTADEMVSDLATIEPPPAAGSGGSVIDDPAFDFSDDPLPDSDRPSAS